jgi:DNA (cytosine-5)-methyltransferase 1
MSALRYGSVCSGVEAATVAWHPLGWEPQWFSEIEKFPSAVLAHHYPNTPNLGDMTAFKEWPNDPIDVLVGGTPCQSFSVAGLRKGLSDPRGNLMLTYLAIAAQYQPKWLVWENVPGVLSSNRGRDFGTFLGALAELGYGFAYRVLDAQYFGVAQRRKRVFVVGYLGDWKRAAAVLFERESLSGHPAPSRETGQKVAPTVTQGAPFSRTGNDRVEAEAYVPDGPAKCLTSGVGQRYDFETENFPIAFGAQNSARQGDSVSETSNMLPVTTGSLCARTGQSISVQDAAQSHLLPIAFGAQNSASQGDSVSEHVTPTLDKSKTPAVATHSVAGTMLSRNTSGGFSNSIDHAAAGYMAMQDMQVRRLTPTECERLQGFPDSYTQIPYRNKPAESCPDGPRYKAMGNSMAVPVMRWIGERINMVNSIGEKL